MTHVIEVLGHNLRYALRLTRLNPGFAIVAILSLALGTGANTAIFQLLDAIRLRMLPVEAPQQLVELRIDDMTHARGNWLRDNAFTNPLWERIRDRQHEFSGIFAWADDSWNLSSSGENRAAAGLWVSGDFFHVLGVQPFRGRLFSKADDRRGCGLTPGAVISYTFWQREFGRDSSIIGRKITVGQNRVEVVGVTAPGFYGLEMGRTFDIALPICSQPAWNSANKILDSGTTWWLTIMGRLRPSATMDQAAAAFRALSPEIFRTTLPPEYPPVSVKPYLAMKLLTIPAGGGLSRLRDRYSTPLALLLAIAGSVLLIACANLTNLMLARATAREREMAVRMAVGASKSRLLGQLLTEGLLLAFVGTSVGLLLGQALSRFLLSFLVTPNDPLYLELKPDWRIFGFSAALAILTCLVFALTPALRSIKTEVGEALKSGGRSITGTREGLSARRILVAAQIALSLVLLVGALLFVRTLRNLTTIDPGFQPNGILIADVNFTGAQLPPSRPVTFRNEILARLQSLPGVETAVEGTIVPLTGGAWNNRFWLDGADEGQHRLAMRSMIGSRYFTTLKTPLIRGRDFTDHDVAVSAKIAIITEKFARELTGGLDVIGKHIWIEATPSEPSTKLEIVGIVKDSKYHDLREDVQSIVYIPLIRQAIERPAARYIIRTNGSTSGLIPAVREALAEINPNLAYTFHVFDDWIQESLMRERLMATIAGLFGILAAILTTVGLYGVISYTVSRRTNEIGIRMALGANRNRIVKLILYEAAVVLTIGLASGAILALAAGRSAATLLYGLQAYDPLAFTIAAAALIFIAVAASALPAWRASVVNPVEALRQE